MEKIIILIGGAPTTGKSTVAEMLGKHLELPWISTDQIREILRATIKRENLPNLFTPKDYTAEMYLTEFSAEEIANREITISEAMWPSVKRFIEQDWQWEKGFIIEGVNLLPHLISNDLANNNDVKCIFLIDDDKDRMRDVVFKRGLWDDADKYSNGVKEKEVEWAHLFGQKIKIEAEKHGYKLIEVKKHKDDLKSVLNALNLK